MGNRFLRFSVFVFFSMFLCKGSAAYPSKFKDVVKNVAIGTGITTCATGLALFLLELKTDGGVSRAYDEPRGIWESENSTFERRAANRQQVFDAQIEAVGNSSEKSREYLLKIVRSFVSKDRTKYSSQATDLYSLYLREGKGIPLNAVLHTLEQEEVAILIKDKTSGGRTLEDLKTVRKVREALVLALVHDTFSELNESEETRFFIASHLSFSPQFGAEAPFKFELRSFSRVPSFENVIESSQEEHGKKMEILEKAIQSTRRFF